jgi:folate-binding protein YgfZ
MFVDQSGWGRIRVTGADRVRFVQGMVTCDVERIPPGGSARGSMLSVKGRVLAVVELIPDAESLLLVCEPEVADKTRQILEKHAIMDDVTFTPETGPLHRVWTDAASVWTAPPILAPAPDGDRPVPWGAPPAEVLRVEAGLARYGVDVSEDHFPFEANLDSGISYTKGCYLGQEVVARAHARGQANKRLVGLRLEGEAPVAAGTKLTSEVRPEAGVVTSSVISPRHGAIALAYVHKTVWEPGTKLLAGDRPATVSALPF